MFIATGQLVIPGAGQSDPTQSSILKVTFTRQLANQPGPFFLPPWNFQTLLNGNTVTLNQGANNSATVSLVVASTYKINGLTVDESTNRLYFVSRVDGTISFVPLQ